VYVFEPVGGDVKPCSINQSIVCLKLEATPWKHTHVRRILRGRLTTACRRLASASAEVKAF